MNNQTEFLKWVCKEKSSLQNAEGYQLLWEGTPDECIRYENPSAKDRYTTEEFLQLPRVIEWRKEYEALTAQPQIEAVSFEVCGTEIIVELNGERECEIDAVDFLDFHCEMYTAWSHDPKTRLVSIPQGVAFYDEDREEYVSIQGRAIISTYDQFFADQHDIKDMLTSYILSADVVVNPKDEDQCSMEDEASQYYNQSRF